MLPLLYNSSQTPTVALDSEICRAIESKEILENIEEYNITANSPEKLVKEIAEYDGYTSYKVNVLDGGFIEIIHWVR